ncbi:helix-turn-helix domain-containing protein [Terrilactibacillus sp. S3-3]|nr:helix-turn-helix domain-containing protein [Terrilactibacillus sp. S3-3]
MLRRAGGDRYQLSKAIFSDIFRCLSLSTAIEAEIFVRQLSGYRRNGRTLEQLSYDMNLDPIESRCLFKSCLRRMMRTAADKPDVFPWLAKLIPKHSGSLSASAVSTYDYLKQCLTLAEIAKKRTLALGTIEDHVVEITLKVPGFDIGSFISDDIYKEVQQMIICLKTRRLKPIKEAMGDRASYFQIRLVLAKEMIEP